jgi:PDZ domain-containing secreted protein
VDRPLLDAIPLLGDAGGRVAVTDGGQRFGTLHVPDVSELLEWRLAQPSERPARTAGVVVWVVVGVIIAIAGLGLYRPPYVVIAPGDAIDVSNDIVIEGIPVDDLDGRYLIATVSLSRRSALATLWSALREDRDVVPVQDVFPPGVRPTEYSRLQRKVFDESRRVAAAAAARAAGLQVVEVDGEPVSTTADVVDAVRSRPTGTDLGVVIERDDTRHTVVVTPEELPDVAGRVGIGVLLETRGLDVDLPFEIRFDELDVGGADLLVVPQSEINQATGEGLTVRGARTLEEALAALKR